MVRTPTTPPPVDTEPTTVTQTPEPPGYTTTPRGPNGTTPLSPYPGRPTRTSIPSSRHPPTVPAGGVDVSRTSNVEVVPSYKS